MKITLNLINNNIKYKKLSTNPFLNQKQKTDSFEKTSFKGIQCSEGSFRLKDLENIHCPICGLLMLNEEQIKEFIADVSNKKGMALAKALEKTLKNS